MDKKFKVTISAENTSRTFTIPAPNEERAHEWGTKQAKQFGWTSPKITTEPVA